jgi:phosphatidylglycerol:prolipoprotein diacylglycerol transferase
MGKVALEFGFIQIYWYSICIVIGMIVGRYLVYKEAMKHGINENVMTNLIFYTVIVSIIGARLYYVVFNWSYYSRNFLEIFEIWNGGLAIHGAIIFGGLYLIYYTKAHHFDTLEVLDICCVGLIIGQAIGRWGNFFNQEAYGSLTTLENLKSLFIPQFIIDGMNIGGVYYHPTFLYESLWNIVGFIILLLVRKRPYLKTGQLFGLYCMWYSLGRFFIEGMRQDSLMLGSMKMAQLVSIAMFVVGVFFFVRRFKSSRFEHLYNNDSSVSTIINN